MDIAAISENPKLMQLKLKLLMLYASDLVIVKGFRTVSQVSALSEYTWSIDIWQQQNSRNSHKMVPYCYGLQIRSLTYRLYIGLIVSLA